MIFRTITFAAMICMAALQPLMAQPDANVLVAGVLQKSALVKSFEADVAIDVDVDFIRIPVKNGKVFYKAPDKFRFRASGFALVPKKGLNFSVIDMLQQPHTAIYAGEDAKNHMVKIVPTDPTADFVIATVWIEKGKDRITKMQVTSSEQGNYTMEFGYGNLNYELPVSTTIGFDIQQLDIPMKFLGNLKVDPKKAGEKTKGNVKLNYTNFKINGSIPDTVFRYTGSE